MDEAVEDVQGTELTVKVSVLELLPDGTGGLGGACVLEINDFDEIRDATEVINGYRLTRESLDGHGDCRVRFLLSDALARLLERGRRGVTWENMIATAAALPQLCAFKYEANECIYR